MTKDPRMTTATDAETAATRDLYKGFGDTFSVAMEMAITPVLFGLLGFALDRWIGTGKLFTIVLATFGVVGMILRTWYRYVASMEAQEADAPWTKMKSQS